MKITVLGDILENYRNGRRQYPPLRLQNALSLSHLLNPVIRYASGIKCTMLPWDDTEYLRRLCYNECLGEKRGFSYSDWLRASNSSTTKDLVKKFSDMFSEHVIIGFDLPPLLQEALEQAKIPSIKLAVHPIRFMNDTLLNFNCAIPQVMQIARNHAVSKYSIDFAAGIVLARHAPDYFKPQNWLYPNSLLIVAPTFYDRPQVDSNGDQISLLDHKDEVTFLAKNYQQVYAFSDNFADFSDAERNFLIDDIGASFIDLPYFERFPLFETGEPAYRFMTHPSITCIAGIYNMYLEEMSYLGKKTVIFGSNNENKKISDQIPIDSKTIISPKFWNEILSAIIGKKLPTSHESFSPESPNLRSLLRGGGGYWDDSSSYKQQQLTYHAYKEINEAHLALSWISSGLASAYQKAIVRKNEPSGKTPFAIYASGDRHILIPAIVALKSFGLQLGNDNLYFLTDEGEISDENAELLKNFEIKVITSTLHHRFATAFRNTPSVAYLQLAGYLLLKSKGFSFSIGIQPDTLCIRPFETDKVFSLIRYIAAPQNNVHRLSYDFAQASLGVPYSTSWQNCDDPGFVPSVLFCNHKGLSDTNFIDLAIKNFLAIGSENLPLNEESLLHVLNFEYTNLCYVLNNKFSYLPFGRLREFPYVLHYDDAMKPWKKRNFRQWHAREEVLYNVWHRAAHHILGDYSYSKYFTAYF